MAVEKGDFRLPIPAESQTPERLQKCATDDNNHKANSEYHELIPLQRVHGGTSGQMRVI